MLSGNMHLQKKLFLMPRILSMIPSARKVCHIWKCRNQVEDLTPFVYAAAVDPDITNSVSTLKLLDKLLHLVPSVAVTMGF